MAPAWWPPPDGEPIGEKRALELVAWLRTVAPAAVELARERLQEHNPGGTIMTYAVPAWLLASQALAPGMRGLAIDSVGAPASSGGYTVLGIALQRDGRLALTIPQPGEGGATVGGGDMTRAAWAAVTFAAVVAGRGGVACGSEGIIAAVPARASANQ